MSLQTAMPSTILESALLALNSCEQTLNRTCTPHWILVAVAEQRLFLLHQQSLIASYPVSTASKGVGNQKGSFQTPSGLHQIAEKIGESCDEGEVFKAREAQGECATIEASPKVTGYDCITSRILWLDGLEEGINSGGQVDSKSRYIYIHGTHEEGLIGQPASIGCVRMKNQDVINLFERVSEGDWVYILA